MPEIATARKLRKQSTPEEKRLWFLIQDRRLLGNKFRRQVKLGPYVVDFCCFSKKLILELDGGHHNKTKDSDFQRDKYFKDQAYIVLRFWNSEMANEKAVLSKIREALA